MSTSVHAFQLNDAELHGMAKKEEVMGTDLSTTGGQLLVKTTIAHFCLFFQQASINIQINYGEVTRKTSNGISSISIHHSSSFTFHLNKKNISHTLSTGVVLLSKFQRFL